MKHEYGIALFHTTSACLRAEKAVKEAGIPCKLVPPPREFSSDCGIAIRFEPTSERALVEALNQAGVEAAAIHRRGG